MEKMFASVKNLRQKYREIFKSCFVECIDKIDKLQTDEEVSDFIDNYYREVCEKKVSLFDY